MHKKEQSLKLLIHQKILPLYYTDDIIVSEEILNSLYEAGIRMVEYTARGSNALSNFKMLKGLAHKEMPEMQLGIGTIKNVRQATEFMNAGADFVVCPIINRQVGQMVHKAGLLWIPGCMSTTEIATAEEEGAEIVKIFPGNILGPSYIAAIRELFPDLKFMPTGGVEPEENNLRNWFNSGVTAVGMGSKLVSKEVINNKNYDLLKEQTKKAMEIVEKIFMARP